MSLPIYIYPSLLHFRQIEVVHGCKWSKMSPCRLSFQQLGTFIHFCIFVFRWSELTVWPQGALVKHVRGLFKAEGVNVTAEPGNSMHGRFYFSFN
jgi:hypothetical protein